MVCFGGSATAAYLALTARSRQGFSAGDKVGWMLVCFYVMGHRTLAPNGLSGSMEVTLHRAKPILLYTFQGRQGIKPLTGASSAVRSRRRSRQ